MNSEGKELISLQKKKTDRELSVVAINVPRKVMHNPQRTDNCDVSCKIYLVFTQT